MAKVDHAKEIVDRVSRAFPHLRCDIDETPGPVDFSAEFSSQPSLAFPVGVHLEGDVLGLYAGSSYHQDFFPASDERVAAQVEDYLRGLLSGTCRVVERERGKHIYSARLEEQLNGAWVVRSRWSRPHIPFLPYRTHILQNV